MMLLDDPVVAWRIGLVVFLYLFIFLLCLVMWLDLRRAGWAARTKPSGRLVVIRSGQNEPRPGYAFPLEPVTTIGRADTNLIRLMDPHVSGAHARLCWQNGRWLLEDLGSTNGTWLNQRLIQEITSMTTGDIMQLGDIQLKLEL